MASPELGLSLSAPHTDVSYRRTLTIQDGDTQIQVPVSGKPSMPAFGPYVEGSYPFWTSDDRSIVVNGTAGGGMAFSSTHKTASWGVTGGATYNLPNCHVRLLGNVGYGGWTTATDEASTLSNGLLVGLGVAARLKRSVDFTLQASWRSDFDSTQSMVLVGARYLFDRALPPINVKALDKLDVHAAFERANNQLADIRMLNDYPLRKRITERLKEDGKDPNNLEELVRGVAVYLTWVRNPNVGEGYLDLMSIGLDMALVRSTKDYVQQVVDTSNPPYSELFRQLESDEKTIPHALAQHGLSLLFMGEDNLFKRVQRLGVETRSKINASLGDTAREYLARYGTLLDLVENAVAANTSPATPPPLRNQLSEGQREIVERFLKHLTCLKTGTGCKPVADEDPNVTFPALSRDILSLQSGKTSRK